MLSAHLMLLSCGDSDSGRLTESQAPADSVPRRPLPYDAAGSSSARTEVVPEAADRAPATGRPAGRNTRWRGAHHPIRCAVPRRAGWRAPETAGNPKVEGNGVVTHASHAASAESGMAAASETSACAGGSIRGESAASRTALAAAGSPLRSRSSARATDALTLSLVSCVL
jgi:hypothetical protein